MEEFQLAHSEMVRRKGNFLIPILKEPLDIDALPDDRRDLKMYLRTHTYIDASGQRRNLER